MNKTKKSNVNDSCHFEKWVPPWNCNAYRFKYVGGEFEWIDGPEKNLEFSR